MMVWISWLVKIIMCKTFPFHLLHSHQIMGRWQRRVLAAAEVITNPVYNEDPMEHLEAAVQAAKVCLRLLVHLDDQNPPSWPSGGLLIKAACMNRSGTRSVQLSSQSITSPAILFWPGEDRGSGGGRARVLCGGGRRPALRQWLRL